MLRRPIETVQAEYTRDWMSIDGVIGTAIGLDRGEKVIKVLVERLTTEIEEKLPREVEGYRIVVEETGDIRPLPAEPD